MEQPAASVPESPHDPSVARQPRLAWLAAGLWTLLLGVSLAWNLYQERSETTQLARTQARVAFDKDLLYRRWSANLGGVYAPVTPQTPPNPYLCVPERDITTPSGRLMVKRGVSPAVRVYSVLPPPTSNTMRFSGRWSKPARTPRRVRSPSF